MIRLFQALLFSRKGKILYGLLANLGVDEVRMNPTYQETESNQCFDIAALTRGKGEG